MPENTSNNGSYQWRSRDDSFLKGNGLSRLPYTPPSGCDYTIAIDDSRTTVNSEYFTIISVRDDGLPSDVACPNVTAGPQNSSGGGGGNGGSGKIISQNQFTSQMIISHLSR